MHLYTYSLGGLHTSAPLVKIGVSVLESDPADPQVEIRTFTFPDLTATVTDTVVLWEALEVAITDLHGAEEWQAARRANNVLRHRTIPDLTLVCHSSDLARLVLHPLVEKRVFTRLYGRLGAASVSLRREGHGETAIRLDDAIGAPTRLVVDGSVVELDVAQRVEWLLRPYSAKEDYIRNILRERRVVEKEIGP